MKICIIIPVYNHEQAIRSVLASIKPYGIPCFLINDGSSDESAPISRKYGRQLTNLWVWINTMSRAIDDGMCGFRLYPLAAVDRVLKTARLSRRMEFDIDIAVRLYWLGVKVNNIPVKVCYPYDGVSHFKVWRDNAMISKIHARLFWEPRHFFLKVRLFLPRCSNVPCIRYFV